MQKNVKSGIRVAMCWLTSCARLFTAFQYVDAFLLIHDRIYAEAFDTFGISKFLLKCF